MSERSMKGTLVKCLSPLDAVAIESPMTGLGIPDINYIGGWIECKALKAWPKGADKNPVKFPHAWTKEQQVWGYRRERAGGVSLVCVKVSSSWFFYSATTLKVNNLWDNMTRPQMYQWALKVFEVSLPQRELCEFLTSLRRTSVLQSTF
jgi:hypothetical protein